MATSDYLGAVIEFADNVLSEGRDIYGAKRHGGNTPLFADGINIESKEHLRWKSPFREAYVTSNLGSQQNLFRVLVGLSRLTGNDRYQDAAKAAIAYHFENLQDVGGLLQWGGHRLVNLETLQIDGPSNKDLVHELKNHFPYYELMFEVDPVATEKFIKGFWNAHVFDWPNLEVSRHGQYGRPLGKLWNNVFCDPPPFRETVGLSFMSAGNDLIYAAATLYKLTGDRAALTWSKRLAGMYVKAGSSKTGLRAYQYTQPLKREEAPSDSATLSSYGDRAKRQFGPEFGDVALEGRMLLRNQAVTMYCANSLMQLQLFEDLGQDATDFLNWTHEGLVAYERHAYVPESGLFRPMMIDGTDLSDYILPRDGYYGRAGAKIERFRADGGFFYSYTRGYVLTGDVELWNVARSVASFCGLGELGHLPGEGIRANYETENADPRALFALLSISRSVPCPEYLRLAQVIGNNIIRTRFRHGYFMSGDDAWTKFDVVEPLALLSLEATICGVPEKVPYYIGGAGYTQGLYEFSDGSVRTRSV